MLFSDCVIVRPLGDFFVEIKNVQFYNVCVFERMRVSNSSLRACVHTCVRACVRG